MYDTLKWLNDIELSRLSRKVLALGLTGRHLLSVSENELISRLEIEDDEEVKYTTLMTMILSSTLHRTHYVKIFIGDGNIEEAIILAKA